MKYLSSLVYLGIIIGLCSSLSSDISISSDVGDDYGDSSSTTRIQVPRKLLTYDITTQYELYLYAASYTTINILSDITLAWSNQIQYATDLVVNGNGYVMDGDGWYYKGFYFRYCSATLRDIYFLDNYGVNKYIYIYIAFLFILE
jgi:hypothetical protein